MTLTTKVIVTLTVDTKPRLGPLNSTIHHHACSDLIADIDELHLMITMVTCHEFGIRDLNTRHDPSIYDQIKFCRANNLGVNYTYNSSIWPNGLLIAMTLHICTSTRMISKSISRGMMTWLQIRVKINT